MIRSIRGRLQCWYGAVYALSIVVFGCLVYWRADRDVNERATLQAVSTAQYLDVSLRSVRPGPNRDGGPMNPPGDRSVDQFSSDFSLGPLPPEFQFRPPRDRRPAMGPPGDRGPESQLGPGGRMGPVSLSRPPEPYSQNDEGRPPMDRMEFVVWRRDGSVLARSDGAATDRDPEMQMPRGVDHPPRIMRGNGYIDAAMKWPHEATILVRRPLENDMAKLPHLFERFYRVDTGRARRHGGSGLGLSICKSLVESHGGSISCQSIPGEGSTFIVRLPLAVFKSNDVFRVVEQEAP